MTGKSLDDIMDKEGGHRDGMRTENEMFHTIINAAKSDDVCLRHI